MTGAVRFPVAHHGRVVGGWFPGEASTITLTRVFGRTSASLHSI